MTIGSLCTGYGGLDQAAEAVLGQQVAWVCDIDKAATTLLAHHHPELPNHHDLTTTDWTQVEPVDVMTAGWPCQPFSQAGRRKGAEDERAIWPFVAAAIRAVRPRLVLLENVSAIVGAGELSRACGDLAKAGYVGCWRCVRASDVGAPHRRERVFIVAADASCVGHERGGDAWRWRSGSPDRHLHTSADSTGQGRRPLVPVASRDGAPAPSRTGETEPRRRDSTPADAGRPRPQGAVSAEAADACGRLTKPGPVPEQPAPGRGTPLADTTSDGRGERRPKPARLVGGSDAAVSGDAVPDPDPDREPGRAQPVVEPRCGGTTVVGPDRQATTDADGFDWAGYRLAIARWEAILGRPAPAPTVLGKRGGRQLSPLFVEWMMGLPAGWVTEVPGLTRNQQLKLLGNGVVPQQAAEAVRLLFPLVEHLAVA